MGMEYQAKVLQCYLIDSQEYKPCVTWSFLLEKTLRTFAGHDTYSAGKVVNCQGKLLRTTTL